MLNIKQYATTFFMVIAIYLLARVVVLTESPEEVTNFLDFYIGFFVILCLYKMFTNFIKNVPQPIDVSIHIIFIFITLFGFTLSFSIYTIIGLIIYGVLILYSLFSVIKK
jgi:chromate transport protein ChrA